MVLCVLIFNKVLNIDNAIIVEESIILFPLFLQIFFYCGEGHALDNTLTIHNMFIYVLEDIYRGYR